MNEQNISQSSKRQMPELKKLQDVISTQPVHLEKTQHVNPTEDDELAAASIHLMRSEKQGRPLVSTHPVHLEKTQHVNPTEDDELAAAASTHPMRSKKLRRPSSDTVAAGVSFAHPLAIDNGPLETITRKRSRPSDLTPAGKENKLTLKRKLDFFPESDLSCLLAFDDAILESDFGTLLSKELVRVLAGGDDHGLDDDLLDIYMGDYQPNGPDILHSSSTLNAAENVPPTPSACDFSSTFYGGEQDDQDFAGSPATIVVSRTSAQMEHSFISDFSGCYRTGVAEGSYGSGHNHPW